MKIEWADKFRRTHGNGKGYVRTPVKNPKAKRYFKRLFWHWYIQCDERGRILWRT